MSALPPVLVTDGEQRSALAVVRSLGAAGHPVIVGYSRPGAIAAVSRFARRRVRLPAPDRDPAAWRDAVREAVRVHGVRLVLPVTEPGMVAALGDDAGYGEARLAGPSRQAFDAIRDKQALLARAATLGIAVPGQHVVPTADQADAPMDVAFPAVLKPARSVFDGPDGLGRAGVAWARDEKALRRALADVPAAAFPVLVQEYVGGPGIGIFGLVWDGVRRATFAHRRIREKPPWGGVSVCSESVTADPDLVDAAFRLLESYDWQGPAMVEFKLDADAGRAVLMEVNGRFWGSLQLAIHAGVDFPRLLARAALGTPEPPVSTWRTGIRNHWEWGEVDAALLRWRRADPVTGTRTRLARVLRDALALRPGRDRAEVARLTDPLPFLRESVAWLRRR